MFKKTVVRLSTGIVSLLLLQACSLSDFKTQHEPSEEVQSAIVQDVLSLVASILPNRQIPVFVQAQPTDDWLYDELVKAILTHGYAIAAKPSDTMTLSVTLSSLGPSAHHLSIDSPNSYRVERIYQLNSTPGIDNHIEHEVGAIYQLPQASPVQETTRQSASFDSANQGNSTTLPLKATNNEPSDSTRVTQALSSTSPCVVSTLHPGSLKQNLEQIFQACGWRISSWPLDPNRPDHEFDWIVASSTALESMSIEELVKSLLQIGLMAELDRVNKTVRISIRN